MPRRGKDTALRILFRGLSRSFERRSPTPALASTLMIRISLSATGKLGDLTGFTSAIILAMIALVIAYELVSRVFAPAPIQFSQAIPIACLGLAVNIASAWLLGGNDRHHGRGHGHGHDHGQAHNKAARPFVWTTSPPAIFEKLAKIREPSD